MKKIWVTLGLLIITPMLFAAVSAELETNQIPLGESFNLHLKMDGNEANAIPNLTPLQKDFQIIGSQRSSSYNIINGQVSSYSDWLILLTAKKAGQLTIPPLDIGGIKTQNLTIDVLAATNPANNSEASSQDGAIILDASISTKTPYLNQQIIYTIKLYNSARLLEASYEPPQADEALIIPFPDGKRYQTMKNGRTYMVEEQKFAIFPQKTGELKIKPPAFHALVYDTTPHQVSVEAKPETLEVAPIPSRYQTKNWLPAKEVILTELHDKNDKTLPEGSTLTRTITLQAKGLPAQLLPDLTFDNSDNFNVYSEKMAEQNELRGDDLIGRKTFKVTYLFNKAGQIQIPVFNLNWFNTTKAANEITSLNPINLTVLAAESTTNPATDNTPSNAVINKKPLLEKEEKPVSAPTSPSLWWLVFFLGLGWLATLIAWKLPRGTKYKSANNKELNLKIKEACLNNDYQTAKIALLNWAKFNFPERAILNLTALAQLIKDAKLQNLIEELASYSYKNNNEASWKGKPLWQAFCQYKVPKEDSPKDSSLPPINKL
ncbi:MAG: BatD family protein [Proteobacteria bacterium]|nr:BatD family protein [Pseudomonadota bacterium]